MASGLGLDPFVSCTPASLLVHDIIGTLYGPCYAVGFFAKPGPGSGALVRD
jgi:hypothetical protein